MRISFNYKRKDWSKFFFFLSPGNWLWFFFLFCSINIKKHMYSWRAIEKKDCESIAIIQKKYRIIWCGSILIKCYRCIFSVHVFRMRLIVSIRGLYNLFFFSFLLTHRVSLCFHHMDSHSEDVLVTTKKNDSRTIKEKRADGRSSFIYLWERK
jgi:hypothetical protein